MWEIFRSTGHIGAYMAYRSCMECTDVQDEHEHLDVNMECSYKNL